MRDVAHGEEHPEENVENCIVKDFDAVGRKVEGGKEQKNSNAQRNGGAHHQAAAGTRLDLQRVAENADQRVCNRVPDDRKQRDGAGHSRIDSGDGGHKVDKVVVIQVISQTGTQLSYAVSDFGAGG